MNEYNFINNHNIEKIGAYKTIKRNRFIYLNMFYLIAYAIKFLFYAICFIISFFAAVELDNSSLSLIPYFILFTGIFISYRDFKYIKDVNKNGYGS